MAADRFFPAKAMTKELDLTFVFVYRRRDFEIVVDMLGRGRIAAGGLVTDKVGFDTFSATFEALKTPGDQIKVMLEPH
jgi:threonine dehydrogenase-like Zn-dependent dehydrogenase